MRRYAWIALGLWTLGGCRSDPDPNVVMMRLDEIDARITALEHRVESKLRAAQEIPAEPDRSAKQADPIHLHVEAETVRFGRERERLPDEALSRRLEAAVRLHGDPSVIVQADPEISSARMTVILDLLERAGVRSIAVARASDDDSAADTDEDANSAR